MLLARPGGEQRRGRERAEAEVRQRVDGAVAADQDDPAVAGLAHGGGELALVGRQQRVDARARGAQRARRPGDDLVGLAGAAGACVDDQPDLAPDDDRRGPARPRSGLREPLDLLSGSGIEVERHCSTEPKVRRAAVLWSGLPGART